MQSPSNIPQRLNFPVFDGGMSVQSSLVDSSNSPAYTEQHPVLQPGPHTNMRYQTMDLVPKLETHPHMMKQEQSTEDENFQHHNSSPGPAYIFSANTSHTNPGISQGDPIFYSKHDVESIPTHFPIPHGFASADVAYEQSLGYVLPSQPDQSDLVTPIQQKPAPTKRGPFKDPQKRIRTAQTRKMGSCIRCRMQRIRVRCHDLLMLQSKANCHNSARLMKNRQRTKMHHVNAAKKSVSIPEFIACLAVGGNWLMCGCPNLAMSRDMIGRTAGRTVPRCLRSLNGRIWRPDSSICAMDSSVQVSVSRFVSSKQSKVISWSECGMKAHNAARSKPGPGPW